MRPRHILLSLLVLGLIAASCGDDDAATPAPQGSTTAAPQASGTSGSGSDGAGSVTFDGETTSLGGARCFLEEQDAGGGGKILATAQASGTGADGGAVSIDFTRYDEDSRFTGDDLHVTVGGSDYMGVADLGTVVIDGRRLSGSGFTLRGDDFSEHSASFELNC